MENLLDIKKLNRFISRYWLALLVIFSIPSFWALLVPGFYGASDDLHIAWLFEMDKVLKMGQIPPRFVPDLSFGFGYPLFDFVFPLPFYIGEIFHLLTFNFVDSVKAVFLVGLTFSTLSMYLLLREFTDEILSFVGALIYLYTPYRSNDVYNRGDIGESLAFIFLPLLALSIIKTAKNASSTWIGIGGLALVFLLLSHNITFYMFFPFVLFLGLLFVAFSRDRIAGLIKTVALIFLGLFCGIYFWLPALIDSSLMKYDTVFNFIDHFPTLVQLIKPYWGYGASVAGPYDGMSFFFGIGNLILLIFGLILSFLNWKKITNDHKLILSWCFFSLLISGFMMNFRSAFLWSHLPLLPYFQFPWRFLIMTTFLIPVFILTLKYLKYGHVIASVLLVLVILLNLNVFRPHDFLGRTDQYYLNRYIPTPIAQKEYYDIQEEYLRLPVDTLVRPNKNYPIVETEKGNILSLQKINDLSVSFQTNSSEEVIANFNKYDFPGWYSFIDDKSLGFTPGIPLGQMHFVIPPGEHTVKIEFKETLLKLILDYISVVAFILSGLLLFEPITSKIKAFRVLLQKRNY